MRDCSRFLGIAFALAVAAGLLTPGGGVRPSPAEALTNCNVNDLTVDAEEQAFLTLINQYRAQNGLQALGIDQHLNRASSFLAQDMATNNYFSHTDSFGRGLGPRLSQCDVPPAASASENIAAGMSGAQAALNGWIGSPPHNAAMLTASFRSIGIARAYGPASQWGWYWATNFSTNAPTGTPPGPPAPPAACSNAQLSSNPNVSSVATNTVVNFTASASCGGTANYTWWLHNGSAWQQLTQWTATNTRSWTPSTPGSYTIAIWVKNAGTSPPAGYDVVATKAFTVTAPAAPCSNPQLSFTPNSSSVPRNSTVNLTASATCGGAASYMWWIFNGSSWSQATGWSSSNTYAWTPAITGNFQVGFWVKNQGSTPANGSFDTSRTAVFTVTAPAAPCTSPNLTFNPLVSSFNLGTTINFTASAACGGTANYMWWVFNGSSWTQATGWNAANTFAWTPTVTGNYQVGYRVKNQGSTPANGSFDASRVSPFTVTSAASPCTASSLSYTPNSTSVARNSTVNFTAAATCGGTPNYIWWVYNGSTWTQLTQWTATNTSSWTPTAAGTYQFGFWVKTAGTTPANGSFDLARTVTFTVN
jgi:uncharacterized protein YkwD